MKSCDQNPRIRRDAPNIYDIKIQTKLHQSINQLTTKPNLRFLRFSLLSGRSDP